MPIACDSRSGRMCPFQITSPGLQCCVSCSTRQTRWFHCFVLGAVYLQASSGHAPRLIVLHPLFQRLTNSQVWPREAEHKDIVADSWIHNLNLEWSDDPNLSTCCATQPTKQLFSLVLWWSYHFAIARYHRCSGKRNAFQAKLSIIQPMPSAQHVTCSTKIVANTSQALIRMNQKNCAHTTHLDVQVSSRAYTPNVPR